MANIVNPNAAGIDISSKEHFVSVPKERSKEDVRCFQSYTCNLHELALWLKECEVDTIAMESTGVYWYHLYTVLLDYGFKVSLVNAHHVKKVPGRKSDVSDARWLQQLHSFGLLNGCSQPDNLTRSLRNFIRQRKTIVKQMSIETQRMQKALEQMNIKLNNVIRDINGKTGRAIIEEILQGVRNPIELARHRDYRIKATQETLIKSLEGNWREEQIFNLRQAYDHYNFLNGQLQECDKQSKRIMDEMADGAIPDKEIKDHKKQKNQPDFNVSKYLYLTLGVEVTKIYGMKDITALRVFSETGKNLKEKFPTEKQFLSWLNLVPDNKITGGKIISSKVKKKKNNAGQAFRDAVNSLWRAKNPIAEYLRRKKAKTGSRQAVVATARKLASIYYKMVTEKVDFNPEIITQKSHENLENRIKYLEKALQKAKSLSAINQYNRAAVI